MDGGGRLLRSIGGVAGRFAPATLAFAGSNDPFATVDTRAADTRAADTRAAEPRLPRRVAHKHLIRHGFERIAHARYLGTMLALALFGAAAGFGAVRGGAYADFVSRNGAFPDLLAKAVGFSIEAVTITGTRELSQGEILKLAGVSSLNSLVFLDVGDIRRRLKAVPLIKEASVSKLYPHRLLIEIEERQPSALWQKDGAVSIVAADGTPIDDLHDPRFQRLPLVVGEGANEKLVEYLGILEAAGDLRDRVRAGIYVAGRRWTLQTDARVAIDLPEQNPAEAVSRLAVLEHDGHILEKDILSLDLRIHGRVVVHLTPDAGAAHAAALEKKNPKKKGATT